MPNSHSSSRARARQRWTALLGLGLALGLGSCAYQQQISEGDAALAAHRYQAAIDSYQTALDGPYQPGKATAGTRLAAAGLAWTRDLETAARAQAEAGHPAFALLLEAKAADLAADAAEVGAAADVAGRRERCAEYARAVLASHPFEITLRPAQADGQTVVRELQDIFREDTTVRFGGGGRTLEVFATQPTIDRQRRASVKTISYISEHHLVPNPRFAELKQQVADAEQRLADADRMAKTSESDMLYADAAVSRNYNNAHAARIYALERNDQAKANLRIAQQNLTRARDEFSKALPEVDRPVYATLTFPLTVWSAAAASSLRVTDSVGGRVIDEPVRVEYTGEMYEAQLKAKLPAQTTRIPEDDQMRVDVNRKAAARVAEWLREQRQNEARTTIERGLGAAPTADAVDDAVRALWMNPAAPSAEQAAALSRSIEAATGIPDGVGLIEALKPPRQTTSTIEHDE